MLKTWISEKCDLLRVDPENSKIWEYYAMDLPGIFWTGLKSRCGHFELKIANKFVKLTHECKIQNDAYDGKIQKLAIFAFVLPWSFTLVPPHQFERENLDTSPRFPYKILSRRKKVGQVKPMGGTKLNDHGKHLPFISIFKVWPTKHI